MFAFALPGKVDSFVASVREQQNQTCPRRQLHLDSWNRDIRLCQNRADGDRRVAANLHPIRSAIRSRAQLKVSAPGFKLTTEACCAGSLITSGRATATPFNNSMT